MSCHCDETTKPLTDEKTESIIYVCPKCQCIYRFVIVRMSDKCFEEKRGKQLIPAPKIKRKRGRPKKEVNGEQETYGK